MNTQNTHHQIFFPNTLLFYLFFFLPIALLYDSKPYDLWDILNVQNIFVMVSHGKLRGALKSDVTVT